MLERGGNELPVQDLLHPGIDPDLPGRLRLHGHRPGPGRPGSVDQQVARDPEQPRPDRPVIGAQLGQVTPGPEEGFLHDVIRARRVGAELPDITLQGLGVEGVQPADDGIWVAAQPVSGNLRDSRHVY